MNLLAFSILTSGVWLSMLCAVAGLAFAYFLILSVIKSSPGNARMQEIAGAIQEGAKAYLNRQVVTISAIAVVIFILLFIFKDHATSVGFVIGAACSLAAGFIGMRIAVLANTRTTQAATISRTAAMRVAFNGGAVTGLLVVGLALLSVGLFYTVASKMIGHDLAVRSLIGLALGASLISVFARLGGGIYTKAADVGADLVGKIENNLDEDDPRNPATIADNVGDNVGDCAGMAADVFETYAVSLIGAILVGALTLAALARGGGLSFRARRHLGARRDRRDSLRQREQRQAGQRADGRGDGERDRLRDPVLAGDAYAFPRRRRHRECSALGERPLFRFARRSAHDRHRGGDHELLHLDELFAGAQDREGSETGHATNIIAGLAIGQHATALPVGFIGLAILFSFHFAGLYGIAIAVMSMLSMAGIIISLDAFGPITDNAGGIAVMSDLPKEVRGVTDDLDAVGNTMKAVTKGYAIASAGLAALVLFGSYVEELRAHVTAAGRPFNFQFSLTEPKVIIGLFIGGLLPFIFTAFSMDAVGKAAGAVVREVRRQLTAKPGILSGEDKPDYGACVDIVTKAALREMIIPALLPVAFVVAVAVIKPLGPVVLGGLLVGTIVTGLFVAIAMTSSGGAWDNAKKYIEEGNLGGKGSFAHAAAVTGDTVGDPYKDTAGPAINPMIKVANIVAILIIPIFF